MPDNKVVQLDLPLSGKELQRMLDLFYQDCARINWWTRTCSAPVTLTSNESHSWRRGSGSFIMRR